MTDFLLSVIIPIFNEEKQIETSIKTIHQILVDASIRHEFVLVNDGSRDATWLVLQRLTTTIPDIHALRLSRNFGKEAALFAGIEHAHGDACAFLDADLQHPPEMLPQMVKTWQETGCDIVEAVKVSRGKEGLFGKLSAFLFYSLLKSLSGFNLAGASDYKLLDGKVVSVLKLFRERNTFFRGILEWVGFHRVKLPFEVQERQGGKTKWTIVKLFKLATNAITSFSSLPLQIVTFLGVLFFIGSIFVGADTLYSKFTGKAVDGATTIILLLLIIGSLLMISLGIIGTYIARIFEEVKQRPRYLVSEMIGVVEKEASAAKSHSSAKRKK